MLTLFERSSPGSSLQKEPDGYFAGSIPHSISSPRLSGETDRPRRSINLPEERRGSVAELLQKATAPPEDRRGSVTFDESTLNSEVNSIQLPEITSTPASPLEETTAQRLSRAASKFRGGSKSRPTSSSGENRISSTLSRLAQKSKEQLFQHEKEQNLLPSAEAPAGMVNVSSESSEIIDVAAAAEEISPSKQKSSKPGKKLAKSIDSKVEANGHHHHKHTRNRSRGNGEDKTRDCTMM